MGTPGYMVPEMEQLMNNMYKKIPIENKDRYINLYYNDVYAANKTIEYFKEYVDRSLKIAHK